MTSCQVSDYPLINQIIDYRNGRYQGSAHQYTRRPYGKGMFLDQNYLFVLSDWIDGVASGKTFAVYPDSHIFYGSLANGRTNKLCVYKQPEKYTIYVKHLINESNVVIIDDYVSQSLLILYVNYKLWSQLPVSQKSNLEIFENALGCQNKLIDVVAHRIYLNDGQRWKIIEQYTKQRIESQLRNYSSFVSSSFDNNSSLSSREDIATYELSYQGSSIVCKINKNENNEEDYSVRLIGIYDEEQQKFQILKKIRSKDKFQEMIYGHAPINYKSRPKECVLHVRQYYKKSTNFYNSFVKTSNFDQIKLFFMALSKYVDYFISNKYAERFLYGKHNYNSIKTSINIEKEKFKEKSNDDKVGQNIIDKKIYHKNNTHINCENNLDQENIFEIKPTKHRNSKYTSLNSEWPLQYPTPRYGQASSQQQGKTCISIIKMANLNIEVHNDEQKRLFFGRREKPLSQIRIENSNITSSLLNKKNLKQLAQDLLNIQREIRQSNTPTKTNKSTVSTIQSQLRWQGLPSKGNTPKQSTCFKRQQDKYENIRKSQIRIMKQGKAWR